MGRRIYLFVAFVTFDGARSIIVDRSCVRREHYACSFSSLPLTSYSILRKKEERNWVLRRFQQLRSYPDEIETRNREEIPYSSRIVPRGLSVAEGP